MSIITKDLILFFVVGLLMLVGVLVGIHINQTVGIAIGFVCFPIACIVFVRAQRKILQYWKAKGSPTYGSRGEESR